MTTFQIDDPIADLSRATLSTYTVPRPVRAGAVDSVIRESRAATPASAINDRKTPRLTMSELNDMDMDEIKKRFYSTPIDTRGPVTRFLDLIDLPRNVLFNIAAGDTARRKSAMGDTASLGLARVNTSDVLESLGLRPGLATGVLGFVGDVALDPLTYLGPAGWGAKTAAAAGRSVSWSKAGAKAIRGAIEAVKTGAAPADAAIARYLKSVGHTAESIAAHPDKAKLASEVETILQGGKPTRLNRAVSMLGEDLVSGPTSVRTLADDVISYRTKDAPLDAAERIIAAQEVQKQHRRAFTKGVRIVKDPTSKIGYRATTSRAIPHGSGIAHIPFTDMMLSVPAFTPSAKQVGLVASLAKNSVSNYEESRSLSVMKELNDQLDDIFTGQKIAHEYASAANKVNSDSPTQQLLSYAGSPSAPAIVPTTSEIRADAREMYSQTIGQMADVLKSMETDPLVNFADLLHAQDLFKSQFHKSNIARAQAAKTQAAYEGASEFSKNIDNDVAGFVSRDVDELRTTQHKTNQEKAKLRADVEAEIPNVQASFEQYRDAQRAKNPAIASSVEETFDTNNKKTKGVSKNKIANESDPAFYDTSPQEWKDLRYTAPGTDRDTLARLAVGDTKQVDVTPYDINNPNADVNVEPILEDVLRDRSEIMADLASKESEAFVGLQMGMKEHGLFSGRVSKIDLSKVQPGDTWYMGDTKVSVHSISKDDGLVHLEVQMPEETQEMSQTFTTESFGSKKKTRTKKDFEVSKSERPRYYSIPITDTPYASTASKRSGNVTVERLDEMGELDLFNPDQPNATALRDLATDRFGVTKDDLADVPFAHGTRFANKSEDEIRHILAQEHTEAQLKLVNQRQDSVPLYFDPDQRIQHEAYADYLHAKADAAARISDATMAPMLATAGSDVQAAVDGFRNSVGLGADDLGSAIMSSITSATEGVARKSHTGRALYEQARNLERTFVNRLGLAPGIAADMVKQFVRAKDITDTQSFRTAASSMVDSLREAGFAPNEMDAASRLIMAYAFVGDRNIADIAKDDQAGRDILEALQTGIIAKPEKAQAIKAIAAKWRNTLDNFATENGIPNYVPNVPTPQGQYAMNYQKNNGINIFGTYKDAIPGSSVPAQQTAERFQHKRSTVEHVWQDPITKKARSILESELAYLQYSNADLETIALSNPEHAAYLRARQEEAASFSALTEAQRQLSTTRYLSPQEINRRIAKEGMFGTLTNKALNGHDFMYADAISAFSAYVGMQERKAARETLQAYLAPHELHLEDIALATDGTAMGSTRKLKTTSGVPVEVRNENGKRTIYIGTTKYRQPDFSVSPIFSALEDVFTTPSGRPIQHGFYPEPIADIIDDVAGFFGSKDVGTGFAKAFGKTDAPDRMIQILKGADTISGYWKVATLLHPSWTINDIIGNLFFMANMGINPVEAAKAAKKAWKIVRSVAQNDRDTLKNITIGARNAADHLDADFGNIIGGHGAADVSRHLSTGEIRQPFTASIRTAAKKAVTGDFAGAKQEAAAVIDETTKAAAQTVDARSFDQPFPIDPTRKVAKAANALVEQGLIRRVWQPWAHLNGLSNDWLKTIAYITLVESGSDSASAARQISEKMLDMSVLTSTDQTARTLVPFYNWMKNSGVLGAREFLRNPKFFSIAPKVKHALEESFNGEQNLPENARPSWIRDQLALQIGTDPDNRRALTLTSSLPTEAATYAISFMFSPFLGAGALQDTLAYGTNSLSPVIKIPLELGARKEFFTKRSIDSNGGDITPTEYLIQQARPLRELGIGSLRGGPLQRAFSDSPVMGVSRALVGGRLQPFDEERRVQNMQREYDDRVDALRRRIGIAERENQKNESLERRVELLRLFNQMKNLGLAVPKWATAQTDSLTGQ